MCLAGFPPEIELAGTSAATTLMGRMRADVPMVTPPRIMHRDVTHAPSWMTIGRVISAMSRRCAWLPVVKNDSCDTTTSRPIVTWSWLWNQTPSPIQESAPIRSFHGNRTLVRGRKTTPRPMSAPNRRNAHTRRRELICQGLVTMTSSTAAHKSTTSTGRSQDLRSPGAVRSGTTGGVLSLSNDGSNASPSIDPQPKGALAPDHLTALSSQYERDSAARGRHPSNAAARATLRTRWAGLASRRRRKASHHHHAFARAGGSSYDFSVRSPMRRAGTPPYKPQGSRSRVTTAPAATTAPSPMFTPGSTVTRALSHT